MKCAGGQGRKIPAASDNVPFSGHFPNWLKRSLFLAILISEGNFRRISEESGEGSSQHRDLDEASKTLVFVLDLLFGLCHPWV